MICHKLGPFKIGLQIALSTNIKRIVIEMDCQKIFTIITQTYSNLHSLAIIMLNCRQLLYSFEEYSLSKISRTHNRCADRMTKEAREKLLPLRTYATFPDFVNETYVLDLLGC